MKTIDLNTVIDREKLSPLQWLVFTLGFLVFFCDGLDTGIIGFIAPALLDDWGISKPQLAPVLSAACILIDIVISYHYTQIVEFGVLLKS